jgi:ferredoxin-NADP reductase
MRALFETLPAPGRELTLLYRASSAEEILFREELEHIAWQRGAQLIFLTGSASDPRNAMSAQNLLALVPDLATRDGLHMRLTPVLLRRHNGTKAGWPAAAATPPRGLQLLASARFHRFRVQE